ncbi:MAG TPA: ParA family protein [Accumulibacter sp.]|uniref:ParA family protein n=1 Tax=Accumulibacter sp. TaxID=2053492 RepID=UPI00287889F7|nr:ParA family protein [Accumulibacter sp.]MDS4054463.1 ParA family protein [Accumulibacter sp.]HMV04874.1 ParA family protein [Accumulibacter sp.]HMW80339.1 ParA family protein [Accumulibacter sp.]HMX69715.1 ParA family protein [Accumulibacter sp.]HNB67371.1 ParA family protein [Accumulibacter sp.]
MRSFLVANPKGGSGKSTLAINLAGHLARSGHRVMLGDVDRQQSSREWLRLRPEALPKIRNWEIEPGKTAKPPKGTTHVVLDTPAGLHGRALDTVVKQVNRVLVPVQPSLFDMLATRHFLAALLEEKAVRNENAFVAVVGMRVDPRTRSATELEHFFARFDVPVLAYLRNTQLYVQTTMLGMTIFDLTPSRAARDVEQWQPIIDWANS